MHRHKFGHTAGSSQAVLVELLTQFLGVEDRGRLSGRMVSRVILWVSLARATLHAASARFPTGVSSETLRTGVQACLPEIEQWPALLKCGLQPWITRRRPRKRKKGFLAAIDLHHQPYDGQPQEGLFCGQSQRGTKRFWSVATAVIVERGERLTLAMTPVAGNRMAEVLDRLWPQLKALGIQVRRVLLFTAPPSCGGCRRNRLRF